MSPLFTITDVHCSYDKERSVLYIQDLTINKGEIVFFIGPSGIGKSTLLELLGLMSNTIKTDSGSSLKFFPTSTEEIDYSNLWKTGDSKISKIRKSYFSFIFQQTNLMGSLTNYENVFISSLLEENENIEVPKKFAKKAIERVFNRSEISRVNNSFTPKELSGGQRQRLSFARAVAKNFKVLFADEPTGNLDVYNAQNTMEQLSEIIDSNEATSIIVSHDIPLSVKYANKIVFISYDSERKSGVINHNNCFTKSANQDWLNYENNSIGNDENMIKFLNNEFLKSVVKLKEQQL